MLAHIDIDIFVDKYLLHCTHERGRGDGEHNLPSNFLRAPWRRRPKESKSGLPSSGVYVTAGSLVVVSDVALGREGGGGGVLGPGGRGEGERRRGEKEYHNLKVGTGTLTKTAYMLPDHPIRSVSFLEPTHCPNFTYCKYGTLHVGSLHIS